MTDSVAKQGILILTAIVVVIIATIALYMRDEPNSHRCNAPCTVVLPPNTLEDEFWFDYGWEDNHTSVVRVYKCKGEVTCYRRYDR